MKTSQRRTISRDLDGRTITIKKAKDIGFGRQGMMYEGTVYIDGKKVGYVIEYGEGSSPSIVAGNKSCARSVAEMEELCRQLDIFDGFAGFCAHLTAYLLDSVHE